MSNNIHIQYHKHNGTHPKTKKDASEWNNIHIKSLKHIRKKYQSKTHITN